MTPLPYYADDTVTVHHGDCLDVLATLPPASVDAVVTDPPYGLEFMGKEWDKFGTDTSHGYREKPRITTRPNAVSGYSSTGNQGVNSFQAGRPFQAWCELWATECLRVLKPGGHLLAFGGTRTSHRLTCAVEDAGFEIRDSIAWLYGSGFPKSLDVSKAIDKAAGVEREVLRPRLYEMTDGGGYSGNLNTSKPRSESAEVTAPATDAARTWQGWGTALKPAHEPVVVARKPLVGTVAGNVLAHGTGALNVDGCRVGKDTVMTHVRPYGYQKSGERWDKRPNEDIPHAGRWPANVVLDESQAAALDQQSGEAPPSSRTAGRDYTARDGIDGHVRECNVCGTRAINSGATELTCGHHDHRWVDNPRPEYVAHPTVKPLALMRWLVRLVTPPGGVVLEPFAGSGATVEACILEGFKCVAIEREADYLPLILQRIHRRRDPVAAVLAASEDRGLFDLLDDEQGA
jgi:DNA modification methylase